MEDATGVDVLQASQNLVDEELDVFVRERLVGLNDLSQVRFHELRDHIDLLKQV